MRLTVGDSRFRMSQNCSPSPLRRAKERLDSETKNSDRLNNRGCSRTTSDIMVEPQRPVLTMKTGGFMRMPSSSFSSDRIPRPARGLRRILAAGNGIACPVASVSMSRGSEEGLGNSGKLVAVEPGDDLLDG